jgi:hypothetical protein
MAESHAAGGAALALELIECIHDVAQKMESVSNLNRVRCAQTHAISDAESAVTRYDSGARMFAKPGGQGCGLIVGQHVNRPADCQIDEQQAKAQRSTMQREIIHP